MNGRIGKWMTTQTAVLRNKESNHTLNSQFFLQGGVDGATGFL